MKTTVPVAVAFLAGLTMVVSFFSEDGTHVGDLSQEQPVVV